MGSRLGRFSLSPSAHSRHRERGVDRWDSEWERPALIVAALCASHKHGRAHTPTESPFSTKSGGWGGLPRTPSNAAGRAGAHFFSIALSLSHTHTHENENPVVSATTPTERFNPAIVSASVKHCATLAQTHAHCAGPD